jgi:hypothetical protein
VLAADLAKLGRVLRFRFWHSGRTMDSRHSWHWKRSAATPDGAVGTGARPTARPAAMGEAMPETAGLQSQLERGRRLLRRMGRHWRFGLLTLVVSACALAVPVLRYHERFLSTAVIYQQQVADPDALGAGPDSGADPTLLQELLLDYQRLSHLIGELGLYDKERRLQGMAVAVAEFRNDITFKPLGKNTFRISFVGDSAEQAQTVTTRLTQTLVDEDRQRRAQRAASGEAFFADEMSRAAVELRAAERELERFVAEHPAYSQAVLPEPGTAPAPPRRAAGAQRPPASPPAPRTARAAAPRATHAEPAAGGAATASAPVAAAPDPAMVAERQAALGALSDATSRLADLRQRYTDEHPSVVAAASRVNAAQARLEAANGALQRSEVDSLYAADTPAAPVAPSDAEPRRPRSAARAPAPDATVAGAADSGPETLDSKEQAALDTQWARLARDVGDARKRHGRLAEDSFRAQVASRSLEAGYNLGVVVLDQASPPDKPIRSRSLLAGLAAFSAFLLSVLLTLARAALDDRIFGEADLVPLGLDPILSVIPAGGSRAITLHEGPRRGESPERA